ncbi:MAG TPA: hypothetical protein VET88_11810 [Gammaproteobacteria bacterium]|nr:hypothetical protein [Gammaproteobacteria bacterium]
MAINSSKGKAAIKRTQDNIAQAQQNLAARRDTLKQGAEADMRAHERAVTQNPKTK